MKTYVLGAGTSATVKYPLGYQLLQQMDKFIRAVGTSKSVEDWARFCRWAESNTNPLIAEAYRRGNLEQLFTVLDFAVKLRSANLDAIGQEVIDQKKTDIPNLEKPLNLVGRLKLWIKELLGRGSTLEQVHRRFEKKVKKYLHYRKTLLRALEVYFQNRHESDLKSFHQAYWNELKTFGRKLCKGDVVITFNYDSTLARILLNQKKWTAKDGYGFELVFQKSSSDHTQEEIGDSDVTVLHLHGASGWYNKPVFMEGYFPKEAEAVPRDVFTPAPIETKIALDPVFLKHLGVPYVDASLPTGPTDEHHILIHPSFLKDYELNGKNVFIELWEKAAAALRTAEEVFIIGYSLPPEDSAALTLLLANTDRKKVRFVNHNAVAKRRLDDLLSFGRFRSPESFSEWLQGRPDCS